MVIQVQTELTIEEICDKARKDIKDIANLIFIVNKRHGIFSQKPKFDSQHSEMKANFMLAYRHLEDARMRLGKVLQAKDGGKSIYDKGK